MKKCILMMLFLSSILYAQKKIAIADFKTPEGMEEIGRLLSSKLMNKLIKVGEFKLIERKDLKKIMEEQKLKLLGIVDVEKSIEIGKLAGADDIIIGEINYCDIETERDFYDGTFYTADIVKTIGKLNAYIKIIEVHSGEIVYSSEVDTTIEWTGYENVTEKEIQVKSMDTLNLLSESKKLDAGENYWWQWAFKKDDILIVYFRGSDEVEAWIGLPDGRYYPNSYKKAISSRIYFKIPENGSYRVVVQNPSSWWSREVNVNVYCLRPRKMSLLGALAVGISKTSEEDKLKRKPKNEEQIFEELINAAVEKWFKDLSGVRLKEKFRVESAEMIIKKLEFREGENIEIKMEVSGGRRIHFFILDEEGYEKWCNVYRKKVKFIQNCNPLLVKLKVNFISEKLIIPASGTYYFIFDNRNDVWKTRTINLFVKSPIL